MNTLRHLCPVKNCDWHYDEPPGFEKMPGNGYGSSMNDFFILYKENLFESYAKTEKILEEHIKTHPKWKIPRKIRKALKAKK